MRARVRVGWWVGWWGGASPWWVASSLAHTCCAALYSPVPRQVKELLAMVPVGSALSVVLGPWCSSDLIEVADINTLEPRATHQTGTETSDLLYISGSSTLPSLADPVRFPRVIRTVSSENAIAKGLAQLAVHYDWRRWGVLHDDSVWGVATGAEVARSIRAAHPAAVFVNEGNSGFNTSEARAMLTRGEGWCLFLVLFR